MLRPLYQYYMYDCKYDDNVYHSMEHLPVSSHHAHCPLGRCEREWYREEKRKKTKCKV